MVSVRRIVRAACLAAVFTTLATSVQAAPSASAPRTDAERSPRPAGGLGRIPFLGGRSAPSGGPRSQPRTVASTDPKEQAPKGIAQSIARLKTRPFVNRKSYVPHEHHAANAAEDRASYGAATHPSPEHYQARARDLFSKIQARADSELGLEPGEQRPRSIEVIEGGAAESPEALALSDGSVLVHRQLIDTADRVGEIMASSSTGGQLVSRLYAMVNGRDRKLPAFDHGEAKHYASGFLSFAVAHEMTHVYRAHFERPLDREGQPIQSPAVDRWRVGKEKMADIGGIELATRAGHSPAGQAATLLYIELLSQVAHMDAAHPPGMDRYAAAYRALEKRASGNRINFSGGKRIEGEPWMSESAAAELARLPKPKDVPALIKKAIKADARSRSKSP